VLWCNANGIAAATPADAVGNAIYVYIQCVAVCCSVLQCAAVCCSVLQCVTVCFSVLQLGWQRLQLQRQHEMRCVCIFTMLQRVAVCCCLLQCVAVCCSVLQCVALCCTVLHCVALCCSVVQLVW